MHPIYLAAHTVTRAVAFLVLAATFVMMLLGWALHAVIAACVFSSFFVLAKQLRAVRLARATAPAKAAAHRR
ncbi:MAG TPA: hypothetical protein VED46_01845 [Alphaproteobacteria bacterium]|nr:hypothetical protein [Alphaproteobacteria bacterium]